MRGWNAKTIDWYLRAGECSQYPDKVLAEIIPRLRPHHTVLDIGCGPGLYALALAPLVTQVLAVDRLGVVLEKLESLARVRHQHNICCIESAWPDTDIPPEVDVIISAFSSGGVMNSRKSIAKILSLKAEAVYLVAPGQYQPPFGWLQHCGGQPGADSTLALLEQMGISYGVKHLAVDFGQPVRDLPEAADFLAGFLHIPVSQARAYAQKIGRPHSRGIYLPNPRNVVLITFPQQTGGGP